MLLRPRSFDLYMLDHRYRNRLQQSVHFMGSKISNFVNPLDLENSLQERQTNIRSPISILPPEILMIIHEMAYGSLGDPDLKDSTRLVFVQACSQWRAVAIGNSRLWSRITIRAPWNLAHIQHTGPWPQSTRVVVLYGLRYTCCSLSSTIPQNKHQRPFLSR